MIARMPLVGEYGAWKGPLKPSGEWRIHLDIVRARPDIGGIVRFQSPYATALAMAGKKTASGRAFDHRAIWRADRSVHQICACRYQGTGGSYPPGAGPKPCCSAEQLLRAGHRPNIEAALVRARELETLAQLYAIALSLGRPAILSDEEVGRIRERMKSNGADVGGRIAGLVGATAKPSAPHKGRGTHRA